ncbi:hypothetical protein TRAPUB_11363 [Trametes pubescens]|uniref:DUF659 domain-containing protein n=1 Tax=Trametes pubescens TaxID=154538 RepID=A0A1M2VX41_TRAPU|nr:hypothetical protein TRAPUB_11363 [Trametes pubescens]
MDEDVEATHPTVWAFKKHKHKSQASIVISSDEEESGDEDEEASDEEADDDNDREAQAELETDDDKEAHCVIVDSLLQTGRISAYFSRKKKAYKGGNTSYTGFNLAKAFINVLKEFGVEENLEKILRVTADNASNNNTIIEHMSEMLTAFQGQFAWTRCFLHITNLTVQSLLHEFNVKAGEEGAEMDDNVRELLELAKDLKLQEKDSQSKEGGEEDEDDSKLLDNDDESWVDEVELLSDEERVMFEREVRPVKMALVKIQRLAFKIIHSTTKILPAWHEILEQKGLPIFREATLFFLRDTLSLAMVILAMDHIDTMLTNYTHPSHTLSDAILAALWLTKKTLNCYYKISDLSATYRIVMMLYPGHKMQYFKHAQWPSQLMKDAKSMLREEYDSFYASGTADNTLDIDNNNVNEASGSRCHVSANDNAIPESTGAILCLGDWVRLDLVRSQDICTVVNFSEVEGTGDDYKMDNGWDCIGTALSKSAKK